jgi:hypothetical protein
MADEILKAIMLTRRAFFPLVLASSALPLAEWGQSRRAGSTGAKLIGLFDKQVYETLAGAQVNWIASAPLASYVGYERIRAEIAVAGPRIVVGITRAADFVIMRSLARDHGLRQGDASAICDEFGGDAGARVLLAGVSSEFDAMRMRGDRHRSWIFVDRHRAPPG